MLSDVASAVNVYREDGGLQLLRSIIHRMNNNTYSAVTAPPSILLHQLHLLLDERAVAYPNDGNWKIVSPRTSRPARLLPTLSSFVANTRHGSERHIRIMEQLYTYDGFVRIEPGDVVVDVGAYVGGFTMFASTIADHVVAIDPNEREHDILTSNTADIENVSVVPKAGWHRTETIEINKSHTPNENSILSPDTGDTDESFEVQGDTIPNMVRELDIDQINYLKVEAEGVEPEILHGALEDEMDIPKIAVDASAERHGADTVSEIEDILHASGYQTRTKEDEDWWGEYIVFARQRQ